MGDIPTGSNIPSVTYDQGAFNNVSNPVSGITIDGYSATTLTAMASGTYEGTGTVDGLTGTFARATNPDGSSPPVPPVTIVIPGFGGGYNGSTSGSFIFSNAILHEAVGDDNVFVADRDDLGSAADYALNMTNLGSPSIDIIGYSLGATAAITLTNELGPMGIDVTNLLTIDPVLLFGGNLTEPSNLVNQQLNFWEGNGGITGLLPGSLGNFGGTQVGGALNIQLPTTHPRMPGAVFYGH